VNSYAYLLQAASVSNRLSALLGTNFTHHRFEDLPHAQRVNNLVANWFLGEPRTAWRDLYLLEYFAKHLREVGDAAPDVLQIFRREFRRARTESQFVGLRFEAYVAASFIRKGILFDKSESPDFRLKELECNVECTTTLVTDDRTARDLSYKVVSAIRKKAESESHRSNCALFIDITNLFYSSLAATSDALRNEANAALRETEFFSVILFAHLFNSDRGRLETIYFREDNQALEKDQQAFLDAHYPILGDRAYDYFFPRSG